VNIISRLLGGSDTNPKFIKTTATNPYRVSRPVAGFVCLGPELQSLMETDKSTLGPFFQGALKFRGDSSVPRSIPLLQSR
jgi:hypothetical protein